MNDLRKAGICIRKSLDGNDFVIDLEGTYCYVSPSGDPVDARDGTIDYQYSTKEEAEEACALYLLKQGIYSMT